MQALAVNHRLQQAECPCSHLIMQNTPREVQDSVASSESIERTWM